MLFDKIIFHKQIKKEQSYTNYLLSSKILIFKIILNKHLHALTISNNKTYKVANMTIHSNAINYQHFQKIRVSFILSLINKNFDVYILQYKHTAYPIVNMRVYTIIIEHRDTAPILYLNNFKLQLLKLKMSYKQHFK